MRIGIFCGATGYGGSQNTMAVLANQLAHLGHEVTLFIDSLRFRSREDISSLEVVNLEVNSVNPVSLGNLSFTNILKILRIAKKQRYDIFLSISTTPLPLVAICGAFNNIPCFYYETGPKMRWASRFFNGTAIANSEETRELMANWMRRKRDTIPIIKARINLSQPNRSSLPKPRGKALKLLMLTRIEYEKTDSVLMMLDAIEILVSAREKNIKFEICGGGLDLARIKGLAEDINRKIGRDTVQVHGPVKDVDRRIESSDIVIGIGRCAWEAMALSKPVLVLGKEGARGFVTKENMDVLMYHNFTARGGGCIKEPGKIADEIDKILASDALRRTYGEYGYNIIKQHYDARIGARQFHGLFDAKAVRSRAVVPRVASSTAMLMLITFLYLKGIAKYILRPGVVMSERKAMNAQL